MSEEAAEVRFVYWQDGAFWLGFLEEFPDYMTQGESLDELRENLVDVYRDLTSKPDPAGWAVALFDDGAVLHHPEDALGSGDVVQGVLRHGHQVGAGARGDRAE